jgi:WD40 repeat protein
MLDFSNFSWTTLFDPSTGHQEGELEFISPRLPETNQIVIFFNDRGFAPINLKAANPTPLQRHFLPIFDLDCLFTVVSCILVGNHLWLSSLEGFVISLNTQNWQVSHIRRQSVPWLVLANLTEEFFIAGSADGTALIWDVRSDQPIVQIPAFTDPIYNIIVAKTGAYSSESCVWLTSQTTISVWKLQI